MLARRYSGLSSREVRLRSTVGVWTGSCELVREVVRPSIGDERAEIEREGEWRGGVGRKSSRLFLNEVGEGEGRGDLSKESKRPDGVRRVGVGVWVEPGAGDCCCRSLSSARALFSFSICAREAGPGTTNRGGGARAEALQRVGLGEKAPKYNCWQAYYTKFTSLSTMMLIRHG